MPVYKDTTTGTWFVKCYYSDYTGQKKQKKKRGFKLQREAKEWEHQFLELQQGTSDMTFLSLYNLYIEDVSHRLRQNSVDGKINVFKNRILPYFKDKPINAITPVDIRAWQNEHMALGYSEAYLNRIHNTMTTIMNYAVNYYNLPSNPCKRAGSMGKRTRSLSFWTIDQYKQVISHVTDPSARMAIQLLFYSGMRLGEMLALTTNDIDFNTNTIHITKSLQRKNKANIITDPKTVNGFRDISMPQTIMTELTSYCDKIYDLQEDDLIFTFTKHLVRYNMQRSSKSADIPFIRIHDLRHSHVSLLIDMGFTPQLIAERIGDTVQMVNSTYGHLYPTRHIEVADKLNDILESN